MRKLVDEVGNRYGKLVVISRNKDRWNCLCDCGRQNLVTGYDLRNGRIRTCGSKECSPNILPANISGLRALRRIYAISAARRGYTWQLTDDQLYSLCQMPCYYCGKEPAQIIYKKGMNGRFLYNGIDRLDNNKNYTIENCVPCCGKCNVAKGSMPLEEFVNWILLVTKTAQKIKEGLVSE